MNKFFEKTLTSQIIVSYLHIYSLSVIYLLTLYLVVFFVPIILKITTLWYKRLTPYNLRNEVWITSGFLFQIPRTVEYFKLSLKKNYHLRFNGLMEKCRNTNSDRSIAYFKKTNCKSMDNSS